MRQVISQSGGGSIAQLTTFSASFTQASQAQSYNFTKSVDCTGIEGYGELTQDDFLVAIVRVNAGNASSSAWANFHVGTPSWTYDNTTGTLNISYSTTKGSGFNGGSVNATMAVWYVK